MVVFPVQSAHTPFIVFILSRQISTIFYFLPHRNVLRITSGCFYLVLSALRQKKGTMQIQRSSWRGIPVCLFHILPLRPQHESDEFHCLHWQMLLFVEQPLVLVFRDVGHHWLSVCLITSQKLLWAFRSRDIFSAPPKHINLILNDKIFQEFRHAFWPVLQVSKILEIYKAKSDVLS